MLFEPTFINPDMRNGLGAGVVDVTKNLTVSWRVNGQPYLAAYQITIYENTAAGTQVYTTGKLTTNCPFYAYSADGEQQTFSHTITSATMTDPTVGMANGNEYKMLITQWWDASAEHDEDSKIVQSSASVFITREEPVVSITAPVSSSLTTKDCTFAGSYTQAQGDTLSWVRWELWATKWDSSSSSYVLVTQVYDTGIMSGVSQLQFYYDGFLPKDGNFPRYYKTILTVCTENGVEKSTSKDISISYTVDEPGGYLTALRACGKSAVLVDWSGMHYIAGHSVTGGYTVSGGKLTLATNTDIVRWDTVSGGEMKFSAPWSFIWKGTVFNDGVTVSNVLFTATQPGNLGTARYILGAYSSTQNMFYVQYATGGFVINLYSHKTYFTGQAEITVIITPSGAYFRLEEVLTTTLYPSDTLYPSNMLVPSVSGETYVFQDHVEADYSNYLNFNIMKVQLSGHSVVDYCGVYKGEPSETVITQAYAQGTYSPWFDGDTQYMMAPFTFGLNAGALILSNSDLSGISIYRKKDGESYMQFVAYIPLTGSNTTTKIYDYAARSQQGNYTWYAFPADDEQFLTGPITSNELNPCLWNWAVMECVEDTSQPHKTYEVINEYAFGKNLSSGTMSNNNTPSVRPNLTRYPTVQLSRSNYQSGTLTSLIGTIDGDAVYSDTIALRDAIYNLSTTKNTLFLKNRKGDLLKIQLNGAVSMTTMDDTREQAQNVTFPWVEVGSAENVSLIAYENGGV